MKSKPDLKLLGLLILSLVLIMAINASLQLKAENRELARAVFHVAWYNVSEEVLAGLHGVEQVYSHFLDPHEANTVWYDPTVISVEQMENALKDGAGYLGTVERQRKPRGSRQE
jgi:hypothetical protein